MTNRTYVMRFLRHYGFDKNDIDATAAARHLKQALKSRADLPGGIVFGHDVARIYVVGKRRGLFGVYS